MNKTIKQFSSKWNAEVESTIIKLRADEKHRLKVNAINAEYRNCPAISTFSIPVIHILFYFWYELSTDFLVPIHFKIIDTNWKEFFFLWRPQFCSKM